MTDQESDNRAHHDSGDGDLDQSHDESHGAVHAHKDSSPSRWNGPTIASFLIALIGLIASLFNCYDAHLSSDVKVVLGKQVRFHACRIGNDKRPLPAIYLVLGFANNGGRASAVTNARIEVKCKVLGEEKWRRTFMCSNEVPNMLVTYGDSTLYPMQPVVMAGHSTEARQYVFAPTSREEIAPLPDTFGLEIALSVMVDFEWRNCDVYSCGATYIWNDLDPSSNSFRECVSELQPISSR
jgi:hypothetical protein